LSGSSIARFKHNDAADLKRTLTLYDRLKSKVLVIEGVYSMEGHISPVREYLQTIDGQNVFTILDDAHGFGVLGKMGRGTAEYLKVTDDIDIVCGSFSKALSSTGGFVAGSEDAINYLRTTSKQTIFSAAISPSQAGAADAVLDIMQEEPEHLEKL
jgi:8-amino-7-oxononanoate synthase